MGAIGLIFGQIFLWSFCIYGIVKFYKINKANKEAAKKKQEDELLKRGEEMARKEVQRREQERKEQERKEQERKEQERREQERRERERLERERKEQEQKRMEELWRENHPKIMAELNHFCEMVTDSPYFLRCVRFACVKGADIGDDETGVRWLTVQHRAKLEQVVEILVERDRLLEKYGYDFLKQHFPGSSLDVYHWFGEKQDAFVSMDVFDAPEQMPDSPEEREELMRLCREHHIHPLIRIKSDEDDFRDLVENCMWSVYLGKGYPGSVDDAATYRDIKMRRHTPEEESEALE